MAEDDISILAEIDDALRADKALHFWNKYGKLLVGGCLCVVLLTGASVFWKNHLLEEQIKMTHKMLEADTMASESKYSDALVLLGVDTKDTGVEWSEERMVLAKVQAAELLLKAGQRDKTITLLKEVVSSSVPIDEAVRDSAHLRLNGLTGANEFAPADADGRPFAPLVQQMKATRLMKEGKNKEAAALLKTVIATAPASSPERERATELLQLTGESGQK